MGLLDNERKSLKYFYNLRATIDESYMLFDEEINIKAGKKMIEQITIILNLIEKLQKENEIIKEANDYYSSRYCEISNNSISIQKVKDKIEEINNEKLNYSEDEYYLENEIKGYAIDKIRELLEGSGKNE